MSIPTKERTFEILLVEDQPGDVGLTREALRRSQKQINLSVASNGEEALAFLRRQGDYAEAVRPDLILLDLNMPRMDGRGLLAEMKKDPALRQSSSPGVISIPLLARMRRTASRVPARLGVTLQPAKCLFKSAYWMRD